ncbi:histamine H3 receptor [Brienomyrus brachyistius]|uniref:histamine H3 receptor n=1 Tax=Brienomyrus brachyistius TaxID=42636 RepID=UPI0020B38139|nr:histamine H3 receptor [Brienomyrus brachyistius]XP_048886279.1 histamine H3 receptor [Brienomyrus brachyistius]
MQTAFAAPPLSLGTSTRFPMSSESQGLLAMNWSAVSRGNATPLELENRRALQYGQFSSSTSVFLAVLMTLLVLATVLGNALVILAFVVEKSLRTQGNFFFLNLAIADFLVGGFCIPVYIPYVLTGEWRLGRGLCKLWLVVDYTLCTASVFNIVLISFDRFISVTRAVNYRCQKGVTRQAVLKMVSVWLAAFLLYGPAIVSWEYIAGGSGVPAKECYAEFYFNWYFLMTASTVEFFTPFISVTYFNLSIYINIRKRNLMRAERPASVGARDCEMELRGRAGAEERQVFFVRPAPAPGSAESAKADRRTGGRKFLGARGSVVVDSGLLDLPPLQVEDLAQKAGDGRYGPELPDGSSRNGRPPATASDSGMASRFRLSRDKKVAKSLAVIVCVFGLCWAPYTLLMIIRAACHGQCVQHYLYETSFWLLWINSSINPVLYPLCHTNFRRAFNKLLCPAKIKIQPQYMEQKC